MSNDNYSIIEYDRLRCICDNQCGETFCLLDECGIYLRLNEIRESWAHVMIFDEDYV